MANPYVNKVVFGGETVVDLTGDTATAADVAEGKTFHLANGAQAVGTASGGGSEEVDPPDDGNTHLFFHISSDNTELSFQFNERTQAENSIDWGDGTIEETRASGQSHTYAKAGDYHVVIETAGTMYCSTNPFSGTNLTTNTRAIAAVALRRAYFYDPDMWLGTSSGPKTTSMFNNCPALKKVIIKNPQTYTTAYTNFARNCYCLEKIELPDGIQVFENYALAYCFSLKKFTIPSAATSLSSALQYCRNLKELYALPETPPSIETSLTGTPSNMVIYVPSASLADYQAEENWSPYASQMVGV